MKTSSAPKLYLDSNEKDPLHSDGRFNFRFVGSRWNHPRHGSRRGQNPAAADDAGGAYASRKYKFAERVDYNAMRDFVVYIKGQVGTNTTVPPSNHVVVNTTRIKQEGAVFDPHVLPVVAGTTVEWPNNDQIFHNVFSMSEAKDFDLGPLQRQPRGQASHF